MAKDVLVSLEGKKKLEEELEYLKTTRRSEVAEAIKKARAFGDLSENSEYDEAKNDQADVESRIAEIEEMLKNVKIIDDAKLKTSNIVHVGSTVRVHIDELENFTPVSEDKNEFLYKIVGTTEANPAENRISDESPIGAALLGAKVGSKVTAEIPGFNKDVDGKKVAIKELHITLIEIVH